MEEDKPDRTTRQELLSAKQQKQKRFQCFKSICVLPKRSQKPQATKRGIGSGPRTGGGSTGDRFRRRRLVLPAGAHRGPWWWRTAGCGSRRGGGVGPGEARRGEARRRVAVHARRRSSSFLSIRRRGLIWMNLPPNWQNSRDFPPNSGNSSIFYTTFNLFSYFVRLFDFYFCKVCYTTLKICVID